MIVYDEILHTCFKKSHVFNYGAWRGQGGMRKSK